MSDTFMTLWAVALQTPLSVEFSRQEYWSGLPFSSPGDLPDSEIEPVSLVLAGGFLIIRPQEKVKVFVTQLCPTLGPHGL